MLFDVYRRQGNLARATATTESCQPCPSSSNQHDEHTHAPLVVCCLIACTADHHAPIW